MNGTDLKVLMVLSRAIEKNPSSGGGMYISQVVNCLDSEYDFHYEVCAPPSSKSPWVLGLLVLARIIRYFIKIGVLIPLQSAIFCSKENEEKIFMALRRVRPQVVVVDTVRLLPLALSVMFDRSTKTSGIPLIIHMEDLLSRRMREWAKANSSIAPGRFAGVLNRPIGDYQLIKYFSALIISYERWALTCLEKCACRAQGLVFISNIEAKMFRVKHPDQAARVFSILPHIRMRRNCQASWGASFRFVYIGADSLIQNRLTIEFLLKLWKELAPATELNIFGKMSANYPVIPNVTFHGYAESLEDVYQPGSVMVYPGFVKGGVKTKVLESFSYGCPVIGNEITFEAIDLPPGYPLLIKELEDLQAYILNPSGFSDEFQRALEIVTSQEVVEGWSKETFHKSWRSVFACALVT